MKEVKRIKYIFLLLFLLSFTAKAVPPPTGEFLKKYGFSVAGSGVFSFFKVDTRHSEAAHMRPGFGGSFRFQIYPTSSVHVQFGLEILSQATRFNTYYFDNGHSQLYDLSFGYTHTLRTTELYLPLMVRVGVKGDEINQQSIFYVLGGYSPKIFLGSNTSIIENKTGKELFAGSTELDYEHQFLGAQVGNVLLAGIGLDRRLGFHEKFISFELIYRYNLSRFNYYGRIGTSNTNELLIKNSCLNLQVGYRFQ